MVMRKLRERKDGFTLIELLIVIAIIAILAAVALPALLRAKEGGAESAGLQVLKSLRNAEETYFTRANPKTYATLTQLYAANSSPVTEAGVDAASGYTFNTVGTPDITSYTITAIAPKAGMLDYTLVETGVITSSAHP